MCAVCFTAAEMVPAMAAAGRAMFVKRTMRRAVTDSAASLPAAPEEPAADERVLSPV